jgi:hypothetical protein
MRIVKYGALDASTVSGNIPNATDAPTETGNKDITEALAEMSLVTSDDGDEELEVATAGPLNYATNTGESHITSNRFV